MASDRPGPDKPGAKGSPRGRTTGQHRHPEPAAPKTDRPEVARAGRRPRPEKSPSESRHPSTVPVVAERVVGRVRPAADDGARLSVLPVALDDGAEGSVDPADPRRSDVDEWGRSAHMRSIVRRLYDPMYRHWFRVEWQGLEKIPRVGGALLVANHAGALPSDAPAIMHGIEEELGRPVYGMADYFFRTIPVLGTMWSRAGGVPADPDNAYRLLHDQQQLAVVFPEGTKGPSKSYSDRYRLRRFGRGGFVEIAMRSGVPVVPIAVVGAEESMPIVFRMPMVAKALRLPYFPVTVNSLLFGPLLGTVLYFPVKIKLRVLDPVVFDVPPGQDRYSKSRVMDEAEQIRSRLQDALHDMLRERRSVWFG